MFSKHNKPTILTAQHYDKKITVEFDHSDTDLNEVMDAVETLIIGMGFSDSSFREWVKDRAADYVDEDIADGKYMFNIEDDEKITNSYVANLPEEFIDDALAQHNADEEGVEFNDYGMRIHNHD